MAVSRWIKALTIWSPPPATRAEQELALERAWIEIAEDFGVEGLRRRPVRVTTQPPRSRARASDDLVEINEHVVLNSWGDALGALLYAAVLTSAGRRANRGRGTAFCLEANRIGSMLGAVYVRPRAHGHASPALWPVIKSAPRVESAAQVLARRVAQITAMLAERQRSPHSKAVVFREVSEQLEGALNDVRATEALPGAEVQVKYF